MSENSDNSYETEIIIDQDKSNDQSEQSSLDSSEQYEEDYDNCICIICFSFFGGKNLSIFILLYQFLDQPSLFFKPLITPF